MKKNISAFIVLMLAAPAFADPLTEAWHTAGKFDFKRAASMAKSCPDARELEMSYVLRIFIPNDPQPRIVKLDYVSCLEAARNDYQPPYTERNYRGESGLGVTINTNEDEDQSEVLISKNGEWIGRFSAPNAELISGRIIKAGDLTTKSGEKFRAEFRGFSRNCSADKGFDQSRYEISVDFSNGDQPLLLNFDPLTCEEVSRSEDGPSYTRRIYAADRTNYHLILDDRTGIITYVRLMRSNVWTGISGALLTETLLPGKSFALETKKVPVVTRAQIRRLP